MNIFKDNIVKNGIFRGMKMPLIQSTSSSCLPKLLGSYEQELLPTLNKICMRQYPAIINIGCSEGYYTIGLALRIPSAVVYAFDIDAFLLQKCREIAILNNVENQIHLKSVCTTENLLPIIQSHPTGFILCDCEGDERFLFTEVLIPYLENWDLIIEVHHFKHSDLPNYLKTLFKDTHNLSIISSVLEEEKFKTYNYKELIGCTYAERKAILMERRPPMEWFYFEHKTIN